MTTPELHRIYPEWEIIRLLGEGAFGKVYEIRRGEGELEEHAALKVIHIPQSESEVKLLQSEGADVSAHFEELARQLSNEIATQAKLKGNSNIVSYEDRKIVPDADGVGQTILIRMELLTPLVDLMAAGAMVQAEVLRLGLDMARALLLCERFHIIHRDIKPQNIFISPAGDYKLGDFGVARQLEQTTANLSRKGTYNYMAPEVFHGRPCNATVDIYSLGIVLYTLLNGNRAPFLPSSITGSTVTNHDRESAQTKRLSGEPLPPLPHVPGVLNEVILKMCAFDSKDRFQNARELMAALEGVAYELQGEETVSLWGGRTLGVAPPMDASTEDEGSRWIDGTPVERSTGIDGSKDKAIPTLEQTAPSAPAEKSKKNPVFIALAAVLAVAVIAGSAFAMLRGHSPGPEPITTVETMDDDTSDENTTDEMPETESDGETFEATFAIGGTLPAATSEQTYVVPTNYFTAPAVTQNTSTARTTASTTTTRSTTSTTTTTRLTTTTTRASTTTTKQPTTTTTTTKPTTTTTTTRPATFTVTYNANGGSNPPASQTVASGTTITLASTSGMAKLTYTLTFDANGGSGGTSRTVSPTLLGWKVNSPDGELRLAGSSYTVTSNVTFYANWMSSGQVGTLPADPTRAGYKFDGWFTSASGGIKITTSDVVSSNKTYYAHWIQDTVQTYTVSYNANGGMFFVITPSNQTKIHNETLTLSAVPPIRTGYTFLGWATSSTASTAQYQSGSSYTNNASVTLYAVWRQD